MTTVQFTDEGWNDYSSWVEDNNLRMLKKINKLIKAIQADPLTGIGKPEPLMYELEGAYSRRIDEQHRLVYLPEDPIVVLSCKYHY